jgi:DNA-binding NtrC family response regulator
MESVAISSNRGYINHLCSLWHCLASLLRLEQLPMTAVRIKSVLVFGDDVRWLRMLKRVLTRGGVAVTCAAWAGAAIDILTEPQLQFDLVIIYLRMPCISGMTAVYDIRKLFPNLTIIVLTSFGTPAAGAVCVRQDTTDFLRMPLETRTLPGTIDEGFLSQKVDVPVIAPDRVPTRR